MLLEPDEVDGGPLWHDKIAVYVQSSAMTSRNEVQLLYGKYMFYGK